MTLTDTILTAYNLAAENMSGLEEYNLCQSLIAHLEERRLKAVDRRAKESDRTVLTVEAHVAASSEETWFYLVTDATVAELKDLDKDERDALIEEWFSYDRWPEGSVFIRVDDEVDNEENRTVNNVTFG